MKIRMVTIDFKFFVKFVKLLLIIQYSIKKLKNVIHLRR